MLANKKGTSNGCAFFVHDQKAIYSLHQLVSEAKVTVSTNWAYGVSILG